MAQDLDPHVRLIDTLVRTVEYFDLKRALTLVSPSAQIIRSGCIEALNAMGLDPKGHVKRSPGDVTVVEVSQLDIVPGLTAMSVQYSCGHRHLYVKTVTPPVGAIMTCDACVSQTV